MLWYIVRRHLDFTIDEWEALPWQHQMVYMEGIEQEFYDPDHDGEYVDDSESLTDVATRGITVLQVEAPTAG
jgi:hypothetical protein